MRHLQSMQEYQELINSGKTVLIDFYAEWCGPCRMLGPIIEEIAAENTNDQVVIAKVNVDEQNEIAALNRIQSIPALIVYQNGNNVWEHHGFLDKNSLVAKLQQWDPSIKF